MAAYSRCLREQRIVLSANVLTPVLPPASFNRCMVGASGTDVSIVTADDQSEYRVVTQGYERELRTLAYNFRATEVAFWLLSVPGGLVILEWC